MDILDPLHDAEAWDRGLQAHPGASVFHSAAWARVLSTTYGHRPFYLRFPQAEGPPALVPLMEVKSPLTGRRGVGLPFSDLCSPLLPAGMDPVILRGPLEQLARAQRWKYLELRGTSLSTGTVPHPEAPSFYAHELDLTPGPERLWKGVAGSVRTAHRKAQNHGLQHRIAGDENSVRQYFDLHTLTRQRHGLPPQPWSFFRQLHRSSIIGPGAGFVVVTELKGQAVGASVFLRHGSGAVYKFGASDERFWDYCPNQMVMWEGIRHLTTIGATSLHFGRTSPHQEGLRRFKLSWGAVEQPMDYIQYRPGPDSWQVLEARPSSRWATRVFHRLPRAINRWAGCLLYPHLD